MRPARDITVLDELYHTSPTDVPRPISQKVTLLYFLVNLPMPNLPGWRESRRDRGSRVFGSSEPNLD